MAHRGEGMLSQSKQFPWLGFLGSLPAACGTVWVLGPACHCLQLPAALEVDRSAAVGQNLLCVTHSKAPIRPGLGLFDPRALAGLAASA